MADPAERDLDQNFARPQFWYRNIFHRNLFGISVEPLSPHGVNHVAPSSPAGPPFYVTLAIMAQPLVVEQSRAIPVPPEAAFTGTVPMPLPTLFQHWYGPIPPIKAVVDQTGDWDAIGKTRTVVLTGGGSMREQITSHDPPRSV